VILVPFRGETSARGLPWVTALLVVANLAVFGWQLERGNARAVMELGFVPARFSHVTTEAAAEAPTDVGAVALLTSMFVHGNVLHLVSNLVYLWVFGVGVEAALGALRFLAFYFASGLGAHAAQFLANQHASMPTVGASGAISGLLAAYLLRYPRARVRSLLFLFVILRWVRVPASLLIGYWLLIQILNGAAELGGMGSGGVAWFEHLGGFFAGFLLFPALHAGRPR
jgi:rhomboid family protein